MALSFLVVPLLFSQLVANPADLASPSGSDEHSSNNIPVPPFITLTSGGHIEWDGRTDYVYEDGPIPLTAVPNSGYVFREWYTAAGTWKVWSDSPAISIHNPHLGSLHAVFQKEFTLGGFDAFIYGSDLDDDILSDDSVEFHQGFRGSLELFVSGPAKLKWTATSPERTSSYRIHLDHYETGSTSVRGTLDDAIDIPEGKHTVRLEISSDSGTTMSLGNFELDTARYPEVFATFGATASISPEKDGYQYGEPILLSTDPNGHDLQFAGWVGATNHEAPEFDWFVENSEHLVAAYLPIDLGFTSPLKLTGEGYFEEDPENRGPSGNPAWHLSGLSSGDRLQMNSIVEGPGILEFSYQAASGVRLDLEAIVGTETILNRDDLRLYNNTWETLHFHVPPGAHSFELLVDEFNRGYTDQAFWISDLKYSQGYELELLVTGGTYTLSPDKPAYAPGESVTISLQPDISGQKAVWQSGASSSSNTVEIAVTDNTTVVASFAEDLSFEDLTFQAAGVPKWTPSEGAGPNGESVLRYHSPRSRPRPEDSDYSDIRLPVEGPCLLEYSVKGIDQQFYELLLSGEKEKRVVKESPYQWERRSLSVPAGNHTVSWRMEMKDPLSYEELELQIYDISITPGYTIDDETIIGSFAVSPDKPVYLPEETITLTPAPPQGYSFYRWIGIDSDQANPQIAIDQHLSVKAEFSRKLSGANGSFHTGGVSTWEYGSSYYSNGASGFYLPQAVPGDTPWVDVPVNGRGRLEFKAYGPYKELVSVLVDDSPSSNPLIRIEELEHYTYSIALDDTTSRTVRIHVPEVFNMPGSDALSIGDIHFITGLEPAIKSFGGRVSGIESTNPFQEGDSITLTAVPDDGNVLAKWTGDVSGDSPKLSHTIAEHSFIEAIFQVDSILHASKVSVSPNTTALWQTLETYDANRSILIEANEGTAETWMEIEIEGPGLLDFNYLNSKTFRDRFVAEDTYKFLLNGKERGTSSRNPMGSASTFPSTTNARVYLPSGNNIVRWETSNTSFGTAPPLLLEKFAFTPGHVLFISDSLVPSIGTVTIQPQKQFYEPDDTITVTVSPKPGYDFLFWGQSIFEGELFVPNLSFKASEIDGYDYLPSFGLLIDSIPFLPVHDLANVQKTSQGLYDPSNNVGLKLSGTTHDRPTVRTDFRGTGVVSCWVKNTGSGTVTTFSAPSGTLKQVAETNKWIQVIIPYEQYLSLWIETRNTEGNPFEAVVDGFRQEDGIALVVTQDESGSVSKSSDAHAFSVGETVTLKASPSPGFRFDGWFHGELSEEIEIEVDVPRTLTPLFTRPMSSQGLELRVNGTGEWKNENGALISPPVDNGAAALAFLDLEGPGVLEYKMEVIDDSSDDGETLYISDNGQKTEEIDRYKKTYLVRKGSHRIGFSIENFSSSDTAKLYLSELNYTPGVVVDVKNTNSKPVYPIPKHEVYPIGTTVLIPNYEINFGYWEGDLEGYPREPILELQDHVVAHARYSQQSETIFGSPITSGPRNDWTHYRSYHQHRFIDEEEENYMQIWVQGDCRLSFEYVNPHRTGEIILKVDNREVEILHNPSSEYKRHHIDLPPGLHLITWSGQKIFPTDEGAGTIRNITRRPGKFLFDFAPTNYEHPSSVRILRSDAKTRTDTISWTPAPGLNLTPPRVFHSTDMIDWVKTPEHLITLIHEDQVTGRLTFEISHPIESEERRFYKIEFIAKLSSEASP